MGFNARIRPNDSPTTATAITGLAPQTLNGTAIDLASLQAGASATAFFTMSVYTSALVMTPKIQVSQDKSTWYDFQFGTATAAGTGAAVVTRGTVNTNGAVPWKWARGVVTTSGSATGISSDTATIGWAWLNDPGI